MAKVSAASFKGLITSASADITQALSDDTILGTASEFVNPMRPERQLERLFNFDPATGIYTANDLYIDAAYAGRRPNVPTPPSQKVAKGTNLILVSATVENAAADDIVLTFNKYIAKLRSGPILGGEAKTLSGTVIASAVVTVTVTVAYVNGNTILISGTFEAVDGSILSLVGQVVTNNVA